MRKRWLAKAFIAAVVLFVVATLPLSAAPANSSVGDVQLPPMDFAPGLYMLVASGDRGYVEGILGQRKDGGYFDKIGPPGSDARLTPPIIMDFLTVGSIGNLDFTLEIAKAAQSRLWLRIVMGGGAWSSSLPQTQEDKERCYAFIDEVLAKCAAYGITPELIVLGNEIDLTHDPNAPGYYKVQAVEPDYDGAAAFFIEASGRFGHLPLYLGLPGFSSGPVPHGVDPWDVYPGHYIKHYAAFFKAFQKQGGLPKNVAITFHSYLAEEAKRIKEIVAHPDIAPYVAANPCVGTEIGSHRWGNRHTDQQYDNYAALRELGMPYVIWIGNLLEPKNPEEERNYEIIGHGDREDIVASIFSAYFADPSPVVVKALLTKEEALLRSKTGVNAVWQPEGVPLSYEAAKAKARDLSAIGFSSTRVVINRKRWDEFIALVKGIHDGGIKEIIYVFQQDSISDELYGRLTGDYANVVNQLTRLENKLTYAVNRTEENEALYSWWRRQHENIVPDLGAAFAGEFVATGVKLVDAIGIGQPLLIEVWNEPNGGHGETRVSIYGELVHTIPPLRPLLYAQIIKEVDGALAVQNVDGRVVPLYGAVFGAPPQVSWDSSPKYLEQVLMALGDYQLQSPHGWSCHLYPGANDASKLLFRIDAILRVVEKDKGDVYLTEVGYAEGERMVMGDKSQRECWVDILATLYPYLADGKLRAVQLYSFDFTGDSDFSYPSEEPEFTFAAVVEALENG